jgi:anti-sigma factor RsiW
MTSERMEPQEDDGGMGRLLRERLPRHPAPPAVRAAVVEALMPERSRQPWWVLWLPPAFSAVATAMIMLLFLAPSLPSAPGADPVHLVTRAVLAEHARNTFWGETRSDEVPVALPRAMEESGVALSWVFTGDEDIQLINARPTYLEGRRGIELAYQDAAGHTVTYIIVPGGSVALPERGRVQIDRWRPVVRKENGFSLILWRQQGLLCVMVSDLVSDDDLARFKQYFVKVRSATEPYAVY